MNTETYPIEIQTAIVEKIRELRTLPEIQTTEQLEQIALDACCDILITRNYQIIWSQISGPHSYGFYSDFVKQIVRKEENTL